MGEVPKPIIILGVITIGMVGLYVVRGPARPVTQPVEHLVKIRQEHGIIIGFLLSIFGFISRLCRKGCCSQ